MILKNKKSSIHMLILIAIILLAAISLQADFAANQTITNSTGISAGITTTGDGDTLTLQEGIYNKSTDRGITINKNITIQGNTSTDKVIIDAQKLNRIFTIGNNVNVVFINLTFINGYTTGNGGAIYNNYANTSITFINCNFINNTARYGGAIYNNGVNFSVNNSNFTSNNATNGGAIYGIDTTIVGNFSLSNSIFTGNNASYGGAIFYELTHLDNIFVSNCSFTGNNASYGGAIFNRFAANFSLNNSIFINNTAGNYGGAICNYLSLGPSYNIGSFSVSNSIFINNTAGNYGGAIFDSDGYGNFSVSNCSFTGNNASYGGALYVGLRLNGSTFVSNCSFTGNNASYGGAIYIGEYDGNFSVSNCSFTDNNASYGGAIFNELRTALKSNPIIFVSNCSFTGNNAANSGGAIYNNGNMSVFGNVMSGNSALFYGSMIYNNGTMGILNLTYLSNTTVYVKYGTVVILYATLTDDMGNTVSGQNIFFYVNGTLVGSMLSIEGYANLTYTVSGSQGDEFPVNGSYNGTGSFE